MAVIEKRKSGDETSYRVKIRLRGHSPVSATFKRLTDAKQWAAATETDIRANRYFGASKRHTLGELIAKYETDALPALKSARAMKQRLQYWRDGTGGMLLSDLTATTIKTHRDKLKATPKARGGGDRTGADVNRTMAALSSVLSYAVKELEWLEANPMIRVRKFAESSGRVRYLSETELPVLLQACRDSKNKELLLAVLLSLSTGARQSEIMTLTWKQVDLKARTALLPETKNGTMRTLPIVGEALQLLQERAKVRRIDDDRIFPAGSRSKKQDAVIDLRAPWAKALATAKITDFHWHDLRHTCASYMAMSGVSQLEMAKLLGHKTLAMTMRYSHLSPQRTIELADGLAKRLGI
jgi:integrase